MTRGRHLYFAYGSNLCVEQMGRRCPDALRPRAATLADHDWLINERGVATIEPFPGSLVHGVLWDVSDADLATLDSAEGVPVRYRRDRMMVHTVDGPLDAWVYIDHRVDAGPPRPGYLERVLSGARHHRLPHHWLEFLGRWDPLTWPRPRPGPDSTAPQTLSELLSEPGVVEASVLRSRIGFMAVHGGGLEKMTDVIAERAAARAGASLYVVRHPEDYPHHLPSARYRPGESALLDDFLDHVDTVISLHGYGRQGRETDLLAGGPNRNLAAQLAGAVRLPGYRVVTDLDAIPRELRGLHPDNPVNRVRRGGTQLELPARVRGISPRSPLPGPDGLSPVTSELIAALSRGAQRFAAARETSR
ncbi:poly-gamma-glutamate hydrolase family protein [Mycolicibacterium palauense]|uniref:poly-gamma-glutamate hydrolase family protein n=1 Tax=Mycolicibacterium palauense TaxID=2034511 RepID=UPI000BFEB96B|nr:poly-gamma-glutamate hydrolase family protein [Mycolicibacterium palauense]